MKYNKSNQGGFTLVELMIVVAIIGLLAAIAIPSFLSYQLKAKSSEARTSLAAIKTASLSFQAERSCFLSVQSSGWPGTIPSSGAQLPWPTAATVPTPGALCVNPLTGAPASAIGTFGDIGFTPSGHVRYNYYLAGSQAQTAAPGPMTNTCPNWPAPLGAGAATGPTIGFMAQAAEEMSGRNISQGSPEEILHYTATYISTKIPVYGRKAPSDLREKINDIGMYSFKHEATRLEHHFYPTSSDGIYTDVEIRRDQFEALIEEMQFESGFHDKTN